MRQFWRFCKLRTYYAYCLPGYLLHCCWCVDIEIILKLIQIYKLFCIQCRRDYYQHGHMNQDWRMTTLRIWTVKFQYKHSSMHKVRDLSKNSTVHIANCRHVMLPARWTAWRHLPKNSVDCQHMRSTLCLKTNETDVTHYKFDADQPIFIIFGR